MVPVSAISCPLFGLFSPLPASSPVEKYKIFRNLGHITPTAMEGGNPLTFFSMATLLLLLLLSISSTATAGHHRQSTATPKPTPGSSSAAASATPDIRQACAATRFPDSCAVALSSGPGLPSNPTSTDLTLAAFSASARNLTVAQSLAEAILKNSASDLNRTNAARNCIEFLSLSARRLAAASKVFPSSLPDARAWAGASLLYQYDCWSALKYVNSTTQVSDAMQYLADLAGLTSNALAMVTAYQRYGGDSAKWGPPQTERDGYWGDSASQTRSRVRSGSSNRAGSMELGRAPDTTVCKDGSCRFGSLQAAVDAAPDFSSSPFLIYIKEGVYEETVRVPYEKTNLVFLGDGMGKTVITGSLNADVVGVSTYNTATVGVLGDGFMARNLTFANTAGPDAHQAVAFRSDSDFSILDSVEFFGHQDTLYAHSLRQYYRRCRISGTVDFIFGNSAAVFESSFLLLLPRQLNPDKGESNTLSAQGRTDPAQPTGFVFNKCTINATDDYYYYYSKKASVHRCYLGRPWKEYSRTVLLNCYIERVVRPEGWLPWNGDFALKTLFYGEFGSTGPGVNASTRVPWSSQIPEEHVGIYSLQNFIQGDQWIPSDM